MSATPPAQQAALPPYYAELASLRGFAAIFVVLFHIPKWNPMLEWRLLDNGYLMIGLFFVLSGFVIDSGYRDRIRTWKDFRRFQWTRIGRLYPVHFVFLMAFLLIELAKYVVTLTTPEVSIKVQPFSINTPGALLEQLLLLQAVLPNGHEMSFNPPAWTVSVEFYAYLVFALIMFGARRASTWLFALIGATCLAALATGMTAGVPLFARSLAGFFTGALLARWLQTTNWRPARWTSTAIAIVTLVFIAYPPRLFPVDIGVCVLSSALIASLVKCEDGVLNRSLRSPFLQWMGLLSYSIYLSHALVIAVVQTVFRRIIGRPLNTEGTSTAVISLSLPEALLGGAVVLVLTIFVGWLSFRYIETPMRNRARRSAALASGSPRPMESTSIVPGQ